MFKRIATVLVFCFSFQAQADLVGGFGVLGEGSFANFSILEYSWKDHLSLNFYIDAESEQRHRQVNFYISVDHYLAAFHSEEDVDVSSRQYGSEILIVATGPLENRNIVIEKRFLDDDPTFVASKEIVRLKVDGNRVSMQIEAFRRRSFFGRPGRLRSVSNKKVGNLAVNRIGVGLYGMNHNIPYGRVVTATGLRKAASDTSTKALIDACEVDCI